VKKINSSHSTQIFVFVLLALGVVGLALGGYLTPLSRVVVNPVVSAQTWLAKHYQAVQSLITQPEDVTTLRQKNA
jgi:hypothetical protein